MVSPINQLKLKFPFQSDKYQTVLRKQLWNKIQKGLPNYIRLREVKKTFKSYIKTPFKFNEQDQQQEVKVAYDYAKDRYVPNKKSDPKFAQNTVSKNQFKFFLRHMRMYYQTLFAWKIIQPLADIAVPSEKFESLIEKLKNWNHFYLNDFAIDEIIKQCGGNKYVSFKIFFKFVLKAAVKYEYNRLQELINEQEQQRVSRGDDNDESDKWTQKQQDKNEDKTGIDLIQKDQMVIDNNSVQQQLPKRQLDNTKYIQIVQTNQETKQQCKQQSNQQTKQLVKQQQRLEQRLQENIFQQNKQQQVNNNVKQKLFKQQVLVDYDYLFKRARQMYDNKQYKQGLQIINRCIQLSPDSSILYCNRALFNMQLQQIEQGYNDLNKGIQLDYFNPIGYFNLYSLNIRYNNLSQGFYNLSQGLDNLCCALSCVYLIRGRQQKNEQYITRSIQYANNNMMGHILKGLMYLQDNKLIQGYNQINKAYKINHNNKIIIKLKNIIEQKLIINNILIQQQQQIKQNKQQTKSNNKSNQQHNKLNNKFKLQCSYTYQSSNIQQQLINKLNQFNLIYHSLNLNHSKSYYNIIRNT